MDEAILELLVCPITHSKLRRDGEYLVSTVGGIKYPIRDGLPVLLPDAAQLPPGFNSIEDLKASLIVPRKS
jgi:uncharacterized protein